MTLRVAFRRAAQIEFEAAAVWYDQQQAGLGEIHHRDRAGACQRRRLAAAVSSCFR